ncbi:MAG: D-alanine--D-alanine ligase [Pseudomonadales bacterium]|nr:D-alanine--D-alanine ligase [Pseudomonadales bacterium]
MIDDIEKASREFGKVAVLMGGDSAERDISLQGGTAVLDALLRSGVNAVGLDARDDVLTKLVKEKIDRVFIMLHGRKGEDGRIQAAMELMNIPYTGSGVLACAIAMDKIKSKQIWQAQKLKTPDFMILDENTNWEQAAKRLGKIFVKPVREGSSIGISRVEDAGQLRCAYMKAREYDNLVMAEKLIRGPEYSISILEDKALPVIELRTEHAFYDFDAKYQSENTQYLCPSSLSGAQEREARQLALQAYHGIGCTGWGRVDIMQDADGSFWLLEVNTVPGMTSHSLVPMAASAAGMDFDTLVMRILASSDIDRNMG